MSPRSSSIFWCMTLSDSLSRALVPSSKNQDFRVFIEFSSYRDSLALPPRYPHAAISEKGIVTTGEIFDKFGGVGCV